MVDPVVKVSQVRIDRGLYHASARESYGREGGDGEGGGGWVMSVGVKG